MIDGGGIFDGVLHRQHRSNGNVWMDDKGVGTSVQGSRKYDSIERALHGCACGYGFQRYPATKQASVPCKSLLDPLFES